MGKTVTELQNRKLELQKQLIKVETKLSEYKTYRNSKHTKVERQLYITKKAQILTELMELKNSLKTDKAKTVSYIEKIYQSHELDEG